MGMETAADKNRIIELLTSFTNTIIWMSLESAEMTKHALNAFLATSVVFANELACLCEKTGADITDVERGLKSESRIGAKAYLRAGNAFAGGTLARDVSYLIQIAQKTQTSTRLFSAVLDSNYHHKQWTNRKINQLIGNLKHKTIAILGLTYKPDTNTLRRSSAIELCHWLNKNEAKLQAFDPSITHLPVELRDVIQLKKNIHEALQNADLAVISTEWKQFTNLSPQDFLTSMKQPIVIDANGFLSQQLANETSIHYFSVGKKT
jgi:UDPglucose 6-dehydrogenase